MESKSPKTGEEKRALYKEGPNPHPRGVRGGALRTASRGMGTAYGVGKNWWKPNRGKTTGQGRNKKKNGNQPGIQSARSGAREEAEGHGDGTLFGIRGAGIRRSEKAAGGMRGEGKGARRGRESLSRASWKKGQKAGEGKANEKGDRVTQGVRYS